jgi:mRNA interferase RelE/StbE
MSYRLETTRRFEKDFRKLAPDLKQRIDKQVRLLETQPYSGKRLRGEFEGSYSLRLGDYRIIYWVEEHAKKIILLTVGHRRRVYE